MMTRTLSAALLLIGVGSTPLQAACPGGVSSYFTVSGEVTKRTVFDLNKLEQFAPAQENVTYFCCGVGCLRFIYRRTAMGPVEQLAG